MSNQAPEWPHTIDKAMDRLLHELPDEDKERLRALSASDLIDLHFSLGMYIRNAFGLWQGNDSLLLPAARKGAASCTQTMRAASSSRRSGGVCAHKADYSPGRRAHRTYHVTAYPADGVDEADDRVGRRHQGKQASCAIRRVPSHAALPVLLRLSGQALVVHTP